MYFLDIFQSGNLALKMNAIASEIFIFKAEDYILVSKTWLVLK